MKKYPCIESTLDLFISDYRVRLWINEERLKDADAEVIDKLNAIGGNKEHIINWCSENVPNINAVQVIDKNGRGIVAYTVNFNDDPHG